MGSLTELLDLAASFLDQNEIDASLAVYTEAAAAAAAAEDLSNQAAAVSSMHSPYPQNFEENACI